MLFPAKLGKAPLVDRTFEIRFSTNMLASAVLPGLFFGGLSGEKTLTRLPMSDLPDALRKAEANLRYAPLIRITWDRFILQIGDQSISVGCMMPYPGWSVFRPKIVEVLKVFAESKADAKIERFSLKAINLFIESMGSPDQLFEVKLQVGPHRLTESQFHIRNEWKQDGYVNVLQMASGATATSAGGASKRGTLLDIDTIQFLDEAKLADDFMKAFDGAIDALHTQNNRTFFECITPETIEKLDPTYDGKH